MNIIEVENLSKQYFIGSGGGYLTLRDTLVNIARAPFSWLGSKVAGQKAQDTNEFWALKDISFSMKPGEVLGIIGRNGAGKSTLLKILSRITPPTTGQVKLRGRVGSLLEVGTGFHPELTGRENILLNGAILGMRRTEILKKSGLIAEFADIGQFLDTPVKRYSSGMYVRLAFAVAVHLEPDILLIDEVLAVGDAEFQKKCLQKMEEVTQKDGRTIIFVSHNISAIERLCPKSILLDKGRAQKYGPTSEVVEYYSNQHAASGMGFVYTPSPKDNLEPDSAEFLGASVGGQSGQPAGVFGTMDEIYVTMEYEIKKQLSGFLMEYQLFNEDNQAVFASTDHDSDPSTSGNKPVGRYVGRGKIPKKFLRPGRYYLSAAGWNPDGGSYILARNILNFEVFANGGPANLEKGRLGVIFPELEWNTVKK